MTPAPEHIPTVDKVNAYLATRAQGDLCRDVMDCNPWPAEAFLMDDLAHYLAGQAPLPHATWAETRLYLRAVSWFLYPALSEDQFRARLDGLTGISATDKALLHGALAQAHEEDALEPAVRAIERAYLNAWSSLQKARRDADLPWRALEGEDLPEAVRAAKTRVNELRPLRDQLYFRRHLAHWLSWSGGTKEGVRA